MTHLGILLRIGVHLGDIIVEDKDIYGHGVNLAARIVTCALAHPRCRGSAARRPHREVPT